MDPKLRFFIFQETLISAYYNRVPTIYDSILDLIYAGSVTLNIENVFGITEAAHFMDLSYVKECCTAYLGDRVTTENWLSLKAYGERYGYEELLEKVT